MGAMASNSMKADITFPNSSADVSLEMMARIAMKEVPLNSAAKGPLGSWDSEQILIKC